MENVQRGFTLIEILIVVAIIGILAAIAIPQYQNHVSKTRITVAWQELNPAKTNLQLLLAEGRDLSTNNEQALKQLGLPAQSQTCDFEAYKIEATAEAGASYNLLCDFRKNSAPPPLKDKHVRYVYWDDGTSVHWACFSNIPENESFYPKSCAYESTF